MASNDGLQITYERDALYYPHIYIRRRDVNWLKATLLCFPHIHRVIPPGFAPDDSPAIRQFRKVKGLNGEPLLQEQDTMQSAVYHAQQKLLKKLKEHETLVREKYSLERAQEEYGKKYNSYKIHRGKMRELISYLQDNGLTWHSYSKSEGKPEWFSLHPVLGSAVMSNIAIAVANDKGLDIVTSLSSVHHSVVSRDDEEVFVELLGQESKPANIDIRDAADDLAEIVMTTAFDVSKLTAQQIADLTKNGQGLRQFKDALIPIAARIPKISNNKVRIKRLKNSVAEVLEEWRKHKKSLPRFALDALIDTKDIKFPEIASSIIGVGASGVSLGLGTGLAVGLLTYSGVKIWRQYKANTSSPFQYLTRIEKAGGCLVLPPIKGMSTT